MVEVLRARHYSRRTEEAYVHWIRRFTLFHAGAHPRELGEGHVNTFLTHVAVKENVARPLRKRFYPGQPEQELGFETTRKEINHADFRTEIKGNSAEYVGQVYDARSGTL